MTEQPGRNQNTVEDCMSEQPKDGGGAFPFSPNDHSTSHMATNGMSLRDWFAGQALVALLSNPNATVDDGIAAEKAFSDAAYKMADALLAARGQS